MSAGRNPEYVCLSMQNQGRTSFLCVQSECRSNRVLGTVPSLLCKMLPLTVCLAHTAHSPFRIVYLCQFFFHHIDLMSLIAVFADNIRQSSHLRLLVLLCLLLIKSFKPN